MTAFLHTTDGNGVELAACAQPGVNADLWFDVTTTYEAQLVCFECPLREACARFAVAEGIREGVWGGLTEQEREAIYRKQKKGKK